MNAVPPPALEGIAEHDGQTSFGEWLQTCAREGSSDLQLEAQSLISLNKLMQQAQMRAEEIQHVRGIAAGLLNTALVSQALKVQNTSLTLKSERKAYLQGAAFADSDLFRGTEAGSSGSGAAGSAAPRGRGTST
ncbi:unnamed protein product [Peniophora sp. CBMAI 1063]|nr:unnamed protein product [Peniophora sp. CBMAI 1063]